MNKLSFTDDEWDKIKNNGTYCSLLFTSKYLPPDGKVRSCCVQTNFGLPQSDPNALNSDLLKKNRKNSLLGIKDPLCKKCWDFEALNIPSMREGFLKYAPNLKNNINEDYTVSNSDITYIDIRFDNTCNLRCRYCGPFLSSSWYNESELLFNEVPEYSLIQQKIPQKVISNFQSIDSIKESLHNVNYIYFAGGEPLLNDNHYAILDYLIDIGRKDIDIVYTTNFTNIKKAIPYWKKLKDHTNIHVFASLDSNYRRGEYIRKNLIWEQIVENRKLMIKEVPDIKFDITATMNIFNAYNVVDFHREWVELGLIEPFDFSVRIIVSKPEHYDLKNLPEHHKNNLKILYNKQIEWLESFENQNDPQRVIESYKGLINRLDLPRDINTERLWKIDKWLDNNRKENFLETFPEYSDFTDIFNKY